MNVETGFKSLEKNVTSEETMAPKEVHVILIVQSQYVAMERLAPPNNVMMGTQTMEMDAAPLVKLSLASLHTLVQ